MLCSILLFIRKSEQKLLKSVLLWLFFFSLWSAEGEGSGVTVLTVDDWKVKNCFSNRDSFLEEYLSLSNFLCFRSFWLIFVTSTQHRSYSAIKIFDSVSYMPNTPNVTVIWSICWHECKHWHVDMNVSCWSPTEPWMSLMPCQQWKQVQEVVITLVLF